MKTVTFTEYKKASLLVCLTEHMARRHNVHFNDYDWDSLESDINQWLVLVRQWDELTDVEEDLPF